MKKLNDIWVPRSRAERWISIFVIWVLTAFLSTAIDGEEGSAATAVFSLFALAFTTYAVTQGTEELKEIDKVNREKRKVKSAENLQEFKKEREFRKRKKEKAKLQKKGIDAETGELICPKCGSSDLSANKKGWTSFLGPYRAKKVYVTCLRCGKRWKAGKYGRL